MPEDSLLLTQCAFGAPSSYGAAARISSPSKMGCFCPLQGVYLPICAPERFTSDPDIKPTEDLTPLGDSKLPMQVCT